MFSTQCVEFVCCMKEPYLDMFDTAAHKLVGLVKIPRYVKYLQGDKTSIKMTFECRMRWLLYSLCGPSWLTRLAGISSF